MVLAAALMVLLAPCLHDNRPAAAAETHTHGDADCAAGCLTPAAAALAAEGADSCECAGETHCHGHSHSHDTTHHHPRVSALPGGHKTAKNHACPAVAPAAAASNPVFSCDSRPAGAFAAPSFRIVPSVSLPLLA